MRELPGAIAQLQRELVEAQIDHIGLQPNLGRELLIARLRVPGIDQNSRVSRLKPNQIDTHVDRFQIDVGVYLVEARIDAAVRGIVADARQCVCDLARADGNAAGLQRKH